MTTLHEQRPLDPGRSGHRGTTRWRLVIGVVVVTSILVAALALMLRGHDGNTLAGSSAVRGSGVVATETRTLPPFTAVELAGGSNVSVRVGAPQSVVVHADDNLIGRVRTSVRSDALVIETTGSFSTRAPMRVSVVVPTMNTVSLSGSGNMTVDGVDSSSFTASLPGSGRMLVGGHAGHLRVNLQGSGEMSMHWLIARSVAVQLSGSGEIEVYAADSLDAEVSGSGSVMYAGNPRRVTTTVTGSGAVEPE